VCWTSPFLELHVSPQPDSPVSGVRTEKAAGLGAAGNDPEVVVGAGAAQLPAAPNRTRSCGACRTRDVRVCEMGRVRKAESVGSYLQRDPFLDLELAQHTEVATEVGGTAELVAVGVSIVSVGRAGNERCGKDGRVEKATAEVALSAGYAGAWRPAANLVVLADEISRLARTIGVQVTACGHGKRHTAVPADQRVDQPAAENPAAYAVLRPGLSLACEGGFS
jgi:hypothetical protein